MRKRFRTWFGIIALLGVALAIYFEPTHCVRGWLWGEAFFDGRPTSYWRGVVERDLEIDPRVIAGTIPPPLPNWWVRLIATLGMHARTDSSLPLAKDAAADGVLQELANHEDPHIAGFADGILKEIRPLQPVADDRPVEYSAW